MFLFVDKTIITFIVYLLLENCREFIKRKSFILHITDQTINLFAVTHCCFSIHKSLSLNSNFALWQPSPQLRMISFPHFVFSLETLLPCFALALCSNSAQCRTSMASKIEQVTLVRIAVVRPRHTENPVPMQLPNNIHLNRQSRHDTRPKTPLAVLLQSRRLHA